MRRIRIVLVAVIIGLLASCSTHVGPHSQDYKDWTRLSLYDDQRVDIRFIDNEAIQQNSEAVFSIWNINQLKGKRGRYSFNTMPYHLHKNLHRSERFYNQEAGLGCACTGFLVAPKIVVTAGHCMSSVFDLRNMGFVVGFRADGISNQPPKAFSKDDVYMVKRLIHREYDIPYGNDFIVAELDRPVEGIKPLKIAKADAVVGDQIYMVGHPNGLPLKFTGNGEVVGIKSTYVTARLEAYGGNSGSPVFNAQHEVIGILVRGKARWVTQDGKKKVRRYIDAQTVKRHIAKASEFKDHVPK